MINKINDRRKHVLVENRIQLRHIGLMVISFIVILLLVEIQVYFLLKNMLPKLVLHTDYSYITGLGITLMVEMAIIIFIIGFINVIYTHRIVGPINRITRQIEHMADTKQLSCIEIRGKDELHHMTSAINKLINLFNK